MPAIWACTSPGSFSPCAIETNSAFISSCCLGDHAGAADLALAIGVGQEGVERAHALHQPLVQILPFVPGDDARDDVEGDGGLRALGRAVGAEGDAVAAIELVDLVRASPPSRSGEVLSSQRDTP